MKRRPDGAKFPLHRVSCPCNARARSLRTHRRSHKLLPIDDVIEVRENGIPRVDQAVEDCRDIRVRRSGSTSLTQKPITVYSQRRRHESPDQATKDRIRRVAGRGWLRVSRRSGRRPCQLNARKITPRPPPCA